MLFKSSHSSSIDYFAYLLTVRKMTEEDSRSNEEEAAAEYTDNDEATVTFDGVDANVAASRSVTDLERNHFDASSAPELLGDGEVENNTVSLRARNGDQVADLPLDDFVDRLMVEIETKVSQPSLVPKQQE